MDRKRWQITQIPADIPSSAVDMSYEAYKEKLRLLENIKAEILADGWEPFAVDSGQIYFRREAT
jgi:hypothetical protein